MPRHSPAACGSCPASWSRNPDTNLVFFDIAATGVDVATLQQRLLARGVAVSGLGGRVRACLHLDVTEPMIEEAVSEIRTALAA